MSVILRAAYMHAMSLNAFASQAAINAMIVGRFTVQGFINFYWANMERVCALSPDLHYRLCVNLLAFYQGRSQTFSFGGATGGASFATRGAVNGLCRTFRKWPEKFLGGHWGVRQNFGGEVAPLAPPNSAPAFYHFLQLVSRNSGKGSLTSWLAWDPRMPEQRYGRGAVKELRAMETYKKIASNCACFCQTTMLTPKIIKETI